MKSRNIQVGQQYMVRNGLGAEVLETGLERYTRGRVRRDGVRIRYFNPQSWKGRESILRSAQVHCLWEQHLEQNRQEEAERKLRGRERRRMQECVRRLNEVLQSHGVQAEARAKPYFNQGVTGFAGNLTLDEEAMQLLIDMLTQEVSQVAPAGSGLSELLSDLPSR